MFAHMPGNRASIGIKPSACGKADNDSDGFVFVKVVCGGCGGLDGDQTSDDYR
jgi:hypothetical protein